MESKHIVSGVIILACLLIGSCCHGLEECYAEEGRTYTVLCAGKSTERVGGLYWEFRRKDENSTELCSCDLDDENRCESPKSGKFKEFHAKYMCQSQTHNSTLQILNVTADLRKNTIECAVYYPVPEKAFVEKSCTLNVYHSPESLTCHTNEIDGKGVALKCTTTKVYPGIVCDIFQTLVNEDSETDGHFERPAEATKVIYETTTLSDDPAYYSASCSTEIYPKQPGKYKFRLKIYPNVSDLTTVRPKEKVTRVCSLPKAGLKENQSMAHVYTLVGVITVVGISVLLLGGYLMWRERPNCIIFRFLISTSREDQGNVYEPVDYTDNDTSRPTEMPTLREEDELYDNSNDDQDPSGPSESKSANGYVNTTNTTPGPPPPPRPHKPNTNTNTNEYITAITPQPTPQSPRRSTVADYSCMTVQGLNDVQSQSNENENNEHVPVDDTNTNVDTGKNINSTVDPQQTSTGDSEDTAVKCVESGCYDRGYESLGSADPQEFDSGSAASQSNDYDRRSRNVIGQNFVSGNSTDQGYRSASTAGYNSTGATNNVDPNNMSANAADPHLPTRRRTNSENEKGNKDDYRSTEGKTPQDQRMSAVLE